MTPAFSVALKRSWLKISGFNGRFSLQNETVRIRLGLN